MDLSFLRKTDLAILHVFPQTAVNDILEFLGGVQSIGCRPGLSLDLKVDLSVVEKHLSVLDTVFVMGIPVATHGLQLNEGVFSRLLGMKEFIAKSNQRCRLGLDGGVNATTFPKLTSLVDELVIGGLLLNADDVVAQWAKLTSMTKGG